MQQYIDQKGARQKAQRCENDDVHGATRGTTGQLFRQCNPLADRKAADSNWDISEMALKNALEICKESIRAISQHIDISRPSLFLAVRNTVPSAIKIIDSIH